MFFREEKKGERRQLRRESEGRKMRSQNHFSLTLAIQLRKATHFFFFFLMGTGHLQCTRPHVKYLVYINSFHCYSHSREGVNLILWI